MALYSPAMLQSQIHLECLFACEKHLLIERISEKYNILPQEISSRQLVDTIALECMSHILNGWDSSGIVSPVDKSMQLVRFHDGDGNDDGETGVSSWIVKAAPCVPGSETLRLLSESPFDGFEVCHIIGAELISPSFTPLVPRCMDDLSCVLSLLLRRLVDRTSKPAHYGWTNDSCALRLDFVLTDPPTGRSTLALQNLITTWGVCETEIERLRPEGSHTAPGICLRRFSLPQEVDRWRFRKQVFEATSMADLRKLLHFDYTRLILAKITFEQAVDANFHESCSKITFWEHPSSLQIEDVTFWTGFVAEIVMSSIHLAQRGVHFQPLEGASFLTVVEKLIMQDHVRQQCWERFFATHDVDYRRG